MRDKLKKIAAEKAVEEIKDGMIVGLGTGSTFKFALEKIASKVRSGELKNILCVPSSVRTESEAKRLGIPLITFEELVKRRNVRRETEDGKTDEREVRGEKRVNERLALSSSISLFTFHESNLPFLDITIDGADEVTTGHPVPGEAGEGSKRIDVIKGGGGALLREKVLAQASRRLIITVDESKISNYLGEKFRVPVEVIPFAASVEEEFLKSLGAVVTKRKNSDGNDYLTDSNNFILDSDFGEIGDPAELSIILDKRAGIVEHGIFIDLASEVVCAMEDGELKIFRVTSDK